MHAIRMIRTGMLAGFALIGWALLVADLVARPEGSRHADRAGRDDDVTDDAWQVIAEARRITEESGRGL
jgi:hypothetical protein